MRMSRRLLFLALLALPLMAHGQQYQPLAERMSSAEFKAAGLDRLTPAQLEALDNWLRTHDKPTTRVVDTSGKPVFYPQAKERHLIEAHLVGQFTGWSGRSVMALDNGQQWKQVGSDTVLCTPSTAPAVKVRPSLFGNWLMYVEGCNGSAHVERVR